MNAATSLPGKALPSPEAPLMRSVSPVQGRLPARERTPGQHPSVDRVEDVGAFGMLDGEVTELVEVAGEDFAVGLE